MHAHTAGKRVGILLVCFFAAVALAIFLVWSFAVFVREDREEPHTAEQSAEEIAPQDEIGRAATGAGALSQVGERLAGHQRRIWKMAVAMAAAGYHLDRSLDSRGAPINYLSADEALRFVQGATMGTRYLGRANPDTGEDVTYWRLDRGFEGEEETRSFLAVEARRSFDRRMHDAIWNEWTKWVAPYSADAFFPGSHPGADLLDQLWSVYEADRKAGWNTDRALDKESLSASIEQRSFSRYESSSRYDLRLSTRVGDYRLEAYLWSIVPTNQDKASPPGEMDEPSARLVLWFTYCPQHETK